MDLGALPFEIVGLPRRRPLLGFATSALGYLAVTAWIVGAVALLDRVGDPSPLFVLGLLTFAASLVLAGLAAQRLDARGRRMRQPDAVSVLESDDRAPVLYLRSFDDDDVHDLTSRTGRTGLRRAEENLCRALRRLGPVIAIGRPGERLPESGAARLYVSDRTWKDAVGFFLDRAAAVVVVVGRSSGVLWEIHTTLERVDREQVLFYFPFAAPAGKREGLRPSLRMRRLGDAEYQAMLRDRDARYAFFRNEVGSRLPSPLPPALGESQFVDFPAGGRPRLLPTVRPSRLDSLLQLSLTNARVGIHFERTLAPFLEATRSLPSRSGR